jgi:hypothetical protein
MKVTTQVYILRSAVFPLEQHLTSTGCPKAENTVLQFAAHTAVSRNRYLRLKVCEDNILLK